jgi:hypothetical protein
MMPRPGGRSPPPHCFMVLGDRQDQAKAQMLALDVWAGFYLDLEE